MKKLALSECAVISVNNLFALHYSIFSTSTHTQVIHLSPPIMEVRDVNFQYAPQLPWLFRGLNFGLDMNSRVCIVGPNGSGKR